MENRMVYFVYCMSFAWLVTHMCGLFYLFIQVICKILVPLPSRVEELTPQLQTFKVGNFVLVFFNHGSHLTFQIILLNLLFPLI